MLETGSEILKNWHSGPFETIWSVGCIIVGYLMGHWKVSK